MGLIASLIILALLIISASLGYAYHEKGAEGYLQHRSFLPDRRAPW